MPHIQEKEQSIETVSEEGQRLDLQDEHYHLLIC